MTVFENRSAYIDCQLWGVWCTLLIMPSVITSPYAIPVNQVFLWVHLLIVIGCTDMVGRGSVLACRNDPKCNV
jgi:hypothetical protein